MALRIFDKLSAAAEKAGLDTRPSMASSARAVDWFQKAANKVRADARKILSSDAPRMRREADQPPPKEERFFTRVDETAIGNLTLFDYKAIGYPNKCPIYDRFPLIFNLGPAGKGIFAGLNVHWLPSNLRKGLFSELMQVAERDEDTQAIVRLNLADGYRKLKVMSSLFSPCYRHYRADHVMSRFLYLPPSQWAASTFLPTARFVGGSSGDAWRQSRSKLGMR